MAVIPVILTFWLIIFVAAYCMWRNFLKGTSSNAKKSEEQFLKLKIEWHENGIAISRWLRAHYQELNLNPEIVISHPEFQGLLWKDFEIYEKLVILNPGLRKDPIANEGRATYASWIRTKGQRPS